MRTSIKITILLIYLAAALPFIYGYETWNYVNNAYITGYSPSCNPYQGLRFLYGANLNSGTAVLNCGGFSKSFNGQGYIMWISDMSNPCNATLTVVTDSKTIISSMPYHVREGIYSIEDGKLNGLPVCPQGQSCFDGVCCTPDCSCSVNTCSGSACSDSCGGFCEGTKQPECSCSVDTCIGQICSDGCGEVCEGKKACKSGEPKVRKVTYEYDLYGNIVKAANLGDIYLTGDEKFSYTEYLYNTDDWIINKPRRNYLKDDASLVSETKFAYDGKNYGSYPTKGDLTYEEYWLDSGPSPVNSYDYDSYGNVITHTNPRGYAITYTYDPTNSFLTRTANAKGHQINYAYDPGTGNLLSSKDANGYITEYAYDTFGRKIKEVLPYDTQNYPTLEIKYYLDGAAPEQIEIIQREVGGTSEAHESYSYLDGFLIAVQNKEETEGSQLTTRDITYDPLYRIKEQSNPYKSSLGYTNPQNVSRKVYSYDSLGRITQTTNPDGTAKKVDYNLWDSTTYDEKGDQKDYTQDAHGRIISVKEYDGQQVYETRYGYDALNNLKEIIDSKGNKIAYGYDSLGRKTGLHDKDIGSWSYSYDSNGNLVRQTDSKGHSTYLSYDELDRLSKKSSPGIDTEYFYDIVTIGTLYKITHPGIETIFQYDSRLRLIDEQKKIEGIVFNAHYSYDSMDRLASKTLPDNSVIEYSYDKEGFVDSIEGLIPHIEYNEMGQPTKRTYDNGIVTNLQYDSDNHRLRRIVTGDKQDLSYSYDDVGNVIRISDSIKGKERLFAYDGLDRLISAKRSSDFDIDYGYDSIGNMLGLSSERLNISFGYSSLPVHSPSSIVYKDSCDVDGDAAKGASCHGDDCDDDNPDIFPGALEICNNVDDDCDGSVDENILQPCGSGQCSGTRACSHGQWSICSSSGISCSYDCPDSCNIDPDGFSNTMDIGASYLSTCDSNGQCRNMQSCNYSHYCSDNDLADSWPPVQDAIKCNALCDKDNDCMDTDCSFLDKCYDGTFREYANVKNGCQGNCACTKKDCSIYEEIIHDNDHDGYDTDCDDDCDDWNQSIRPGAYESCNKIDDNCDGKIDEGCCYSNWVLDNSTCQIDDKKLMRYIDTNNCGTKEVLPQENGTYLNCDYCNSTWVSKSSSCGPENYLNISYNYTNNCCALTGLVSDCNIPKDTAAWCDYCTPYLKNGSWSSWVDVGCLPNDTMNQSRSRVQSDANNCGEIGDKTFVEYRASESCDYCRPGWILDDTPCEQNNQKLISYHDLNYCNESQNLPVDNGTYSKCNYIYSFNISLTEGWNLISIPLNLENRTLPEPFASIRGQYAKLFAYQDGKWVELIDGSDIDETMGLWVNIIHNTTLMVKGEEIQNFTYSLPIGRNLVGYPSLNKASIGKVFNLSNIMLISLYNNSKWSTFTPKRPYSKNQLIEIHPGLGYWVELSE